MHIRSSEKAGRKRLYRVVLTQQILPIPFSQLLVVRLLDRVADQRLHRLTHEPAEPKIPRRLYAELAEILQEMKAERVRERANHRILDSEVHRVPGERLGRGLARLRRDVAGWRKLFGESFDERVADSARG